MTGATDRAPLCTAIASALLAPPAGNLQAGREYVRLFLSPQGALCSLWQSVWDATDDGPRLLGAPHHSALEWYRRFGFEPAIETEPADHAGLLLLFYVHLIESGAAPAAILEFERAHLAWLGRFGRHLLETTNDAVYSSIGESLAAMFA